MQKHNLVRAMSFLLVEIAFLSKEPCRAGQRPMLESWLESRGTAVNQFTDGHELSHLSKYVAGADGDRTTKSPPV
jgi:hypothetical protein